MFIARAPVTELEQCSEPSAICIRNTDNIDGLKLQVSKPPIVYFVVPETLDGDDNCASPEIQQWIHTVQNTWDHHGTGYQMFVTHTEDQVWMVCLLLSISESLNFPSVWWKVKEGSCTSWGGNRERGPKCTTRSCPPASVLRSKKKTPRTNRVESVNGRIITCILHGGEGATCIEPSESGAPPRTPRGAVSRSRGRKTYDEVENVREQSSRKRKGAPLKAGRDAMHARNC